MFSQVQDTKYEFNVQDALVSMVIEMEMTHGDPAPLPNEFCKLLSIFLIKATDKTRLTPSKFDDICEIYSQFASQRPNLDIRNLKIAL